MHNRMLLLVGLSVFAVCGILYWNLNPNSVSLKMRVNIQTEGYLTVPFNGGRMANHLFHIADGYALAKKLSRQFYIPYDPSNSKQLDYDLERINYIFPRMKEAYVLLQPNMTVVDLLGKELKVTEYIDPRPYRNVTAKYVNYRLKYGQNWNYFGEFDAEIRELFTVSRHIQVFAEEVIDMKRIEDARNYLCIHIRRTDFTSYGTQSNMDPTTAMASRILSYHNLTKLAMFGDDRPFMEQVVGYLEKNNMTTKGSSYVSTFSEGMDFHMAQRLCKAFIITAPVSTFGFWLGYMTEDQENVYYLDERSVRLSKPITKDIFPPSWKSLTIANDSTVTIN